MNYYDYKGIQNGKYAQGEIEAINKDEAAYKLRGQKIIITSLEKSKKKSSDKEEIKPDKTKSQGKLNAKVPNKIRNTSINFSNNVAFIFFIIIKTKKYYLFHLIYFL